MRFVCKESKFALMTCIQTSHVSLTTERIHTHLIFGPMQCLQSVNNDCRLSYLKARLMT